jgi:hypothetical protein
MLNSFFLSAYLTQNMYGYALRDWNYRALSRNNFHQSFLYFKGKTSVNFIYWSTAVGSVILYYMFIAPIFLLPQREPH